MGNCHSNQPVLATHTNNTNGSKKKDPTNLQEGLLRERNLDVYSKYQTIEILGQGSMGQVVRVRLIDDPLKGSKLSEDREKILASTKSTSSISQKRYDKVEYGTHVCGNVDDAGDCQGMSLYSCVCLLLVACCNNGMFTWRTTNHAKIANKLWV